MRINCPQCGASLQMLDGDFYIRCPYCSARIPGRLSGRDVRMARAVLDEKGASRLFKSGTLESVKLRYYPYALSGSRLVAAFNQPVSELEGYTPPTGDTVQFDPSMADPDQVIPPGDEHSDSTLIFHPVWVVLEKAGGAAAYVDAVGGNMIGRPAGKPWVSRPPSDTFVMALAAGLAGAVPVYVLGVLSHGEPADLFGVSIAGALSGIAILYVARRSRRR